MVYVNLEGYGKYLDLRKVHELKSGGVSATTGSKVHDDISIGMFRHGFFDFLIYWQLQINSALN
jgi:hypothetical protein